MFFRGEFPDWCLTVGLGRSTAVRLSLWFFPLFAAVAVAETSFAVAGLVTAAFFVAAVVHAACRLLPGRLADGNKVSVDLGPLGGLVTARPVGGTPTDPLFTAGAIGNGLTVAVVAAALDGVAPTVLFDAINPFALPRGEGGEVLVSFPLLLVHASVVQMLVAILPVRPFAAGLVAAESLAGRVGTEVAETVTRRLGVIAGFGAVWTAAAFGNPWFALVGLTAVAAALRPVSPAARGMTSDGDAGTNHAVAVHAATESDPTREDVDARVDDLLAKVHREGLDGLTRSERRFLRKSSARYRS